MVKSKVAKPDPTIQKPLGCAPFLRQGRRDDTFGMLSAGNP